MFKDFKEFNQFMIFLHTHYNLYDVWNFKNGDKGILFEGWHHNVSNTEPDSQKYSPNNLPDDLIPDFQKRNTLAEIYELWQKVKDNLPNIKY